MLIALLVPIVLAGFVQSWLLIRTAIARKALRPRGEAVAVGAATNFFDTLGIGSFAPTLAWLKFRGRVPDRFIPGTMLVSHALPTIVQAVIFLILLGVHVDPALIAGSAIALLIGGLAGAPLALRMRVWVVQIVVATALLIAALLYALSNLDLMPVGGTAASLPIPLMVVAIIGNFLMGVLLNFGVGHYAPSLIMLSLMGLDPRLAFPIMATAGALTVAGVSTRHIPAGNVDLRTAISFAIGGIPAVLIAAFVVKSMSVEMLRWLVIVVVVYAAAVMLREAAKGRAAERAPEADKQTATSL
ncbi:TSUP family transporter [Sphingosinicella rhizophila]|uniref:Probable membrane transporter protein n=1 Tax=Sphingosinicella rhizophila TaxID=3050082 RepID=A0ABU3Q9L0_9SPHN|nr:TSUP family transporter [Sphingosinicella sp. GR2756]MDT9600096.1 TSUP family transporter [Sphingosinicella sp. GR2756]